MRPGPARAPAVNQSPSGLARGMMPAMDGDGFADSRYARLRWNTPLSESHADQLLGLGFAYLVLQH